MITQKEPFVKRSSAKPKFRRLRAYAFDPSLSLKMDTIDINNIVYKIPWEELKPGPIGEYVEIMDIDPTTGMFYTPVDLNSEIVLAEDGLEPSESNPKFHQQMVYAVIMTTIRNFEQALGRKILWAPRYLANYEKYSEYVHRLRVYPHAMKEANAYYSPLKKALLFGYFASTPANETLHMPDSLVFNCLSADVISHEVTHAILDGIHPFYNEPTNPDVLALHEAFSDIVALFQHFTFPEVLKHQIAKTRGDLASQNLLGQLAQEFGSATGKYGSLRDAIGEIDPETKKWKMKEPSPAEYREVMESHARGSILVAAVFEAFINIYKDRIADLLRIATNGTSILPNGELQSDLVNRLSNEASKAAKHVLNMCIRALDYCPCVDPTFGDYLRAIITADVDLVDDDSHDYRLAFIDAFRKRGIYPEGIKTLSVESLTLSDINLEYDEKNSKIALSGKTIESDEQTVEMIKIITNFLKEYANEMKYINDRETIFNRTREYIVGRNDQTGLHKKISIKFQQSSDFENITGLAFVENPILFGLRQSTKYNGPSFQIQNLRLISRIGPDNKQINYVLFSIIQKSGIKFKNGSYEHFEPPSSSDLNPQIPEDGIIFKGGCTLIFDLDTLRLKYAISKPLLEENNGKLTIALKRAKRQYDYQKDEFGTNFNEYTKYYCNEACNLIEPFNFLHQ